jgi:hypothetical protein
MGACCYANSSDPVSASYYECLGNNGYFQTIPDGQELEDITCPDLGSRGCCCSCSYVDDFDDYLQNQQTYTGGVRDVTFCECNTLGGVWSEGQLCEDIDVFGLCIDGGGINDDVRIPQACCHDDTCDNVCSVQECADLIVDDPEGTLISFATCNYPIGNHPVAECGTDPAMRRMGERDRLTNIIVTDKRPTKKDRVEIYKGKVNQEQNQSCCIYEQNNEVKCSQLTKTQCTIKGGVWGGLDAAGQSVDCDSTIAEHFKNIVQNDGKIDSSYVDGWGLGQEIFDGGRFAGVFNSSTNTFGSGSVCLGNRQTGIAKDYISESTMNVDPSFSSTKYAVIVSAEDIHQVFDVDAGSGIKQNKIKNASYCDTLRNKRLFSSSIIQRLISVNDSQYVKWSIPSLDCLSFMQRNMLTDEFKTNSIKNQSPRSEFVPMKEKYYWSSTPYDIMMASYSNRNKQTPTSSSNIVGSIKMNPVDHVRKNENTGMYNVYNEGGKKVKGFKYKAEANKYAIDNHDSLMKSATTTRTTTRQMEYSNIESDMEDVVYFYTQLFRETVSDKTESFVKVSPYNIKLHGRPVWLIPIK